MRRNTLNGSKLLRAGAVLLGLGLAACQTAADPPREIAAAKSLSALSAVVTNENYQQLGFHSVAEVAQAATDESVPVYMVRLDHLKEYRAGQDPGLLLTDLESAFYPVRVHGEVHSSMEMHKTGKGWEARSFGNAAHAKVLDQARTAAAHTAGLPTAAFFEVRVLALNTYLLGHQSAKGLMLTAMIDEPSLGMKAGESKLAAEVFQQLHVQALAHNGLPT